MCVYVYVCVCVCVCVWFSSGNAGKKAIHSPHVGAKLER